MTKDILPWLLACLFLIGIIVLVVLSYVSIYKKTRGFLSTVKDKISSWDKFVIRTGLQWELKHPGVVDANDTPVSVNLFGSGAVDRTGRVVGNYRNYAVVLENQTRSHVTTNVSQMAADQDYFTEILLTVENKTGMELVIHKDNQLSIKPENQGMTLLKQTKVLGRLTNLPGKYEIALKGGTLIYVSAGIELDPDRLYSILEILCDMADSLKSS